MPDEQTNTALSLGRATMELTQAFGRLVKGCAIVGSQKTISALAQTDTGLRLTYLWHQGQRFGEYIQQQRHDGKVQKYIYDACSDLCQPLRHPNIDPGRHATEHAKKRSGLPQGKDDVTPMEIYPEAFERALRVYQHNDRVGAFSHVAGAFIYEARTIRGTSPLFLATMTEKLCDMQGNLIGRNGHTTAAFFEEIRKLHDDKLSLPAEREIIRKSLRNMQQRAILCQRTNEFDRHLGDVYAALPDELRSFQGRDPTGYVTLPNPDFGRHIGL